MTAGTTAVAEVARPWKTVAYYLKSPKLRRAWLPTDSMLQVPHIIGSGAIAAAIVWGAVCSAADPLPPPAASLADTEADARRRLDGRMSASWSGAKFRDVAYALGKNAGLGVVVDRRLDSEQAVEVSLADTPLRDVFQALGQRHGVAVSWFGPLVYLGPPASADRLRTLALLRQAEVQQLPVELRGPCSARRPLAWAELAEPRPIVEQLAAEAGLKVVGIEQVPHDLWPAVSLPPLSVAERLTLVLAQFDLTFRIDHATKTLRLAPITGVVAATRTFPLGATGDETIRRWQALCPTADIRRDGARIVVVGRAEDFDRITGHAPAQPAAVANAPAGTQVYTLRVKDVPLAAFINVLRQQYGLKIRVDEEAVRAAGISLDKHVQVAVEKATLVEMLEQAAAPLGLTAKQVGDTVEIAPRK